MSKDVRDDVRERLKTVTGAEFQAARLEVRAEAADMVTLIRRSTDGWVCTGDAVFQVQDGQVEPVTEGGEWNEREVLWAELVLGPSESVHVRRMGADLRAYRYREGAGEDVLARDETFESTEDGRRLTYRSYWHLSTRSCDGHDLDVWLPHVSRFTGWSCT